MNADRLSAPSLLLGRILLSLIFLVSGFRKLFAYAATVGYMEKFGMPGMLLPLVIVFEIGGGLLLVAGLQTRIVAFAMAGFSLLAGVIFHYAVGDAGNMLHFWKNAAIAGGFLCLLAMGGGAWSADAMLQRTRFARKV
ncbi:MAG: DoxX family protein [Rhodoblastus sp.]